MSDHGHFSSYEGHKERRTGKIRGTFSRMHRALDGWMLARAPVSPAIDQYVRPREANVVLTARVHDHSIIIRIIIIIIIFIISAH